MAKANLENKTTLEKYNESKTDAIPEGIKERIKYLTNYLVIFFERKFLQEKMSKAYKNLKELIKTK